MIDEIMRAIETSRYRVGDRLPSERVLAEGIGVGRAAVREAFSALQVMGVIERRIGDGTYVAKAVKKPASVEAALQSLQENKSLGEVWEARRILEGTLGRLATEKVTPGDLEEMAKCLKRIEVAISQSNYDDYTSADRDFHLSLAAAAKNPFLEQALSPILEITHQQVATQVDAHYIVQHGQEMIERHRAILHALENKDRLGIKQVIDLHFVASEKLFLGVDA